jgi:hypothetical protein
MSGGKTHIDCFQAGHIIVDISELDMKTNSMILKGIHFEVK